jgi:hypothetical protein
LLAAVRNEEHGVKTRDLLVVTELLSAVVVFGRLARDLDDERYCSSE